MIKNILIQKALVIFKIKGLKFKKFIIINNNYIKFSFLLFFNISYLLLIFN